MGISRRRVLVGFAAIALLLPACQGVYYDTMERFGVHKRDILRDRVTSGQEEQREAEEQFQTAYERFKAVSGASGGDLEKTYDRLAQELARSEEKAEAVTRRIESIEQVAADLFEEWKAEIDQIQNQRLRDNSRRSLGDTKKRYGQLIRAMKRAESKMEPVLVAFRDQVLYLKHNLNAQAISALEGSVASIEDDVAALIGEIRVSIAESERFLASMENAG